MEAEPPKPDPPKRKRRWFQFSLRTLMIFTAVIAIACGWVARKTEQKRREREALRALAALNPGHLVFFYDYQCPPGDVFAEPPGPAWLRKLLGDDFFGSVDGISISQTAAQDASLVHLKYFPELHSVDLSETNITDLGLANLESLTQLEVLFLAGTKITDAGMAHLKDLTQLTMLNFDETGITDAGLANMIRLPQLQTLYLRETAVTDAGLKHLRTLNQLSMLFLHGAKVSDAGVRELQKALPNCMIDR
jgi:Leucine rich repeat